MANKEVQFTLKEAVTEVLASLTGLDLEYDPSYDRFQSVARALNRGLRAVALEHEWSYYTSIENVGTVSAGDDEVELSSGIRPRSINDDSVRLTTTEGRPLVWAYFLPRDALHKYIGRGGLWCSVTRSTLKFSRPFLEAEAGLQIIMPAMREPKMFAIPEAGTGIPERILRQSIDFDYPDLVIARAALYIADSDPVMQPRVQTLEARYKDIMYQLIARDDAMTDSPYENDFFVPIQNSINGPAAHMFLHRHPHADERHH